MYKRILATLDFLIPLADKVAEHSLAGDFALTAAMTVREEVKEMAKWTPFYVNTLTYMGLVSSPQQWGKVKKKINSEHVGQMRRNDQAVTPTFGYRAEYHGEKLLKFFSSAGMKL